MTNGGAHAVAFRLFDTSGSGFITEADLVSVLEKGAGGQLSHKQLQTVRGPVGLPSYFGL